MPAGNLVVNPGAEAGAGSPDASQQLPLPGWTVESTFTAVQYGAPGFLTAADSTALVAESTSSPAGPVVRWARRRRSSTWPARRREIDAGKVTATLSALLGGYATQTDYAALGATFLNAGGATLGAIRLVAVSPGDRNSVTALVARSSSAPVPAERRHFRAHRRRPRGGLLQRRLHRQREPRPRSGGPPVFHKSVGVKLVSGRVGIRRPGSKQEVDLKGSDVIPLGSTIDAEKGALELSSVPKRGAAPQTAKFYEGVFKVTQSGGTTALALAQPLASCRGRAASAAAKKKPSKRHLWGDGKGAFRTSGKYSSATVRGTKWLVQDSCAGTLTRVVRGSVTVRDKVRRKTVTVAAGKSYLARARR